MGKGDLTDDYIGKGIAINRLHLDGKGTRALVKVSEEFDTQRHDGRIGTTHNIITEVECLIIVSCIVVVKVGSIGTFIKEVGLHFLACHKCQYQACH